MTTINRMSRLSVLAIMLFFGWRWVASSGFETVSKQVSLRPIGDTPGVSMHLPGFGGSIGLTLPELINNEDSRLVYTDTNLKHVEWQHLENGTIRSIWRQEALAAYELMARPTADGVALEWTISNLGSREWSDAAGNICMRSHHVPELFDPSGERVFVRTKARWLSAKETWKRPGRNWYLPPEKEVHQLMRPLIGEYQISDFRPDEAVVAIRSRDGDWVIAQAWHEARYLIINLLPNYACTEASPYLGSVKPGETVRLTGKIYFFRGDLEKLESSYQADLRNGRIAFQRLSR
jgi:hypothetical protein